MKDQKHRKTQEKHRKARGTKKIKALKNIENHRENKTCIKNEDTENI